MQNIKITCTCCKKPVEIPGVDAEKLEAIQVGRSMGMSIQSIIPEVSPDYREIFISGICPTCWDNMFGSDEEEESIKDSTMELA
jgi:hypothetical protein